MATVFDIRCARPAPRWGGLRPRALPRGEALLALVPMEEKEGRQQKRPRAQQKRLRPLRLSRRRRSRRRPTRPRPKERRRGAEARSKRRRGSRGGRGEAPARRGADAAAEAAAGRAAIAGEDRARSPSGASARSGPPTGAAQGQPGGQRRRQPPRRAPLPAAKRELLISVDVGEQRVAVVEDDRVAEVYLERPERRSIAGNIYLGVVDNVLPGMEAAFVEIGLEKNGFLYVDEIVVPELEGKRHGKKIQDLISRGEQLLVQAVKDPMKTKGARLTTEISLPGRFLVYVPNGEGLGVSRRLEDAERARLKDIIKALDVKEGGVIVRTAAEGASAEDVERDLVFLQRLWKTIQARAKARAAPALVYQEAELPLRIVRDLFAGDFVSRPGRQRAHAQAHRQLPEEDVAAHDRARAPLQGEGAAVRELRRREGDRLDPRSSRRPSLRRLPRLRLRRGVHRDRRQHRSVRRLALEELEPAARGHDHEEQSRGRQGGRAPAPAARHRRDHRDRLHRHGEPEEPGVGRGCAARRSSSATARRPTSSRSRRSASSR